MKQSKSERLKDIYRYFDKLRQEARRSDAHALIPFPVVAYYRASRRLAQMPAMGDIFSLRLERDGAFHDALNAGVDYQAMCQWFYLRENQEFRERFQIRNDPEYEFPDLRAVRHAVTIAVEILIESSSKTTRPVSKSSCSRRTGQRAPLNSNN